jgi:DNA-binding NarL/FixJ family response regulator
MILDAEPDLAVVGEAADGPAARAAAAALDPDVVLLDIRMPGEDGLAVLHRLVDADCRARILMLTTFDHDEYVYDALTAGATGFLLKDMAAEDIVAAVRQAGRGLDGLLAPALTRRLVERFAASGRPVRTTVALDRLSPREAEVLRELATGRSNQEIGRTLHISETTVKTHVARVLAKLGVRDRVQAVIAAYEAGVVVPADRRGE